MKKKKTEIEIKVIVIIMKYMHVFINLKFMFKLANSFHQKVMNDTNKKRYSFIFMRS